MPASGNSKASSDSRPIRTFLAVTLPEEVRDLVEMRTRKLKETCQGVRWIPAANWHLTLKFLGDLPRNQQESVTRSLEQASSSWKPFAVTYGGLGTFPSGARPRVFWAGVLEGGKELANLARQIDSCLQGIGIPAEQREYRPHLTLGRARPRGKIPGNWVARWQAATDLEFGGGLVRKVTLFQSELSAQGARYRPLAQLAFPQKLG